MGMEGIKPGWVERVNRQRIMDELGVGRIPREIPRSTNAGDYYGSEEMIVFEARREDLSNPGEA